MLSRQDIYIRDPFVLVEDNVYYLFGTTDPQAWSGKASGFIGYKSVDLEHFEEGVLVFTPPNDFWSDENFWAPEVHKYKGKFYMLASFFKTGHCRGSQILCSDTVLGQYTPLTKLPFTPPDWECLDATLYVENEIPYVVFSHEWTQIKDGTFCMAQLSSDLSHIVGEIHELFHASEAEWVRPIQGNNQFVTDGAFLYRLNSGKLVMLWSSMGEHGYAMGLAEHRGGCLYENWKHIPKPLFEKNGGHGMLFKDRKGFLKLTLHAPNEPHMSERFHYFDVEETVSGLQIVSKINRE